jgi:hypothetical protein
MLQGKKQLYSHVSNAEDIAEYPFRTTYFVDQGGEGGYEAHEMCCKVMMKEELQKAMLDFCSIIFSTERHMKDM